MLEIIIYSDWNKGVAPTVVNSIAKAREFVKKQWGAEIDLPPEEEDDFATAPIVMELCGNHKEIGLVQQDGLVQQIRNDFNGMRVVCVKE